MSKYRVVIKESVEKFIDIEAESLEQAKEQSEGLELIIDDRWSEITETFSTFIVSVEAI